MSVILAKDNGVDTREMRAAYCGALMDMMDKGEPVVALDADLMRAAGLLPHRDKYPENIIECGIAECNMFGVAAGLSAEGYIPFPHSFAAFSSRRAFDQIFMSGAYTRQSIKVVGSDPGLANALNGGTHAAHEDIAMMRTIPGITIIEPTDYVMTRELTYAAAKTPGMFYIRLFRMNAPVVYEEGSRFQLGEAVELRQGTDVTIIAQGMMVPQAIQAAKELELQGISVRLLDMFTIKPLDEEAVQAAARETGAIVTAENHSVVGGLGGAVAEYLAEHCPVPMERVGVRETFGEVGPTPYLMERFGMTAGDIAKKAMAAMKRK